MPDDQRLAIELSPGTAQEATAPDVMATDGAQGKTPANDDTKTNEVPKQATSSVSPLCVGDIDERGNTIKYIYAVDPHYVIYYSRLERDDGKGGSSAVMRGLAAIGSFLGAAGAADEREGVQAQLSSKPEMRQKQLRNLLPLGTERAKLRALLSGWPRRESYDYSIATALQLALDGDGDPSSVKNALGTLSDAKASISSEREIAGRGQWASYAILFGAIGFVLLDIARHNLFHQTGNFWLGTQAGVLGAMFSIAIGISSRTVAPNTNASSNLTDSILRLLIGAISGGTIVLVSSTGLVPQLHTYAGDLDGSRSYSFVLFLGIIGGFVERLVPGILEGQGQRLGGQGATASNASPGPADAASAQAGK
jgi:hypothetical protein